MIRTALVIAAALVTLDVRAADNATKTTPAPPADAPARILGAATLGIGIAALLARDHVDAKGGLAAAYGLALYNVLAGALILWSSAVIGLGGAMLWGAGLFHALVGLLFVYALVTAGRR